LLHICDVTAEALTRAEKKKVGLLGTAFTMEMPFYIERLSRKFGLDVLVPDDADRAETHRIIFDELVHGLVSPKSKQEYREIISRLVAEGAEAVVLGCTELMMIITAEDSPVPLFDTTTLHCEAALGFAIDDSQVARHGVPER